jgi:hypothetical protein
LRARAQPSEVLPTSCNEYREADGGVRRGLLKTSELLSCGRRRKEREVKEVDVVEEIRG